MSQEIQHLSERWWWGSVQSYGRPTPPPHSCLNTHTHTHTRAWTQHLFRFPEKKPGTTHSHSLRVLTQPQFVIPPSFLSMYMSVFVSVCVCVCVTGMRRNFPGLQGVEGCLVYVQAPPSLPAVCCFMQLQPWVLLLHPPLLPSVVTGLKTHTHTHLKKLQGNCSLV